MLQVGLLDDNLKGSFYPLEDGFESSVFISAYDNIIKIFKGYVPNEILTRKEKVLISLSLSQIYDEQTILPELYQLIYTKDGKFIGYCMEPISGVYLNDFCEELVLNDILDIFRDLQTVLNLVHNNGFCLTDFNPENVLIAKDRTIKLIDVDSFCLMNSSTKNIFCNSKYICPYSKKIDIKYNIYSFYSLFIDVVFKVNRMDNNRKDIIQTILQDKTLPNPIKDKLMFYLKIRNKAKLQQINYLF